MRRPMPMPPGNPLAGAPSPPMGAPSPPMGAPPVGGIRPPPGNAPPPMAPMGGPPPTPGGSAVAPSPMAPMPQAAQALPPIASAGQPPALGGAQGGYADGGPVDDTPTNMPLRMRGTTVQPLPHPTWRYACGERLCSLLPTIRRLWVRVGSGAMRLLTRSFLPIPRYAPEVRDTPRVDL